MTKEKSLHKFTMVAARHGFVAFAAYLNGVDDPKMTLGRRDVYVWVRKDTDNRQHSIYLWIWDNGQVACFYHYHQTNKIYAPCHCDNANQLSKALAQDGF